MLFEIESSFDTFACLIFECNKFYEIYIQRATYLVIERWLYDDCQFYYREYRVQTLHRTPIRRQVLRVRLHRHRRPPTVDLVSQYTFLYPHHLCDKYNRPDWIPDFKEMKESKKSERMNEYLVTNVTKCGNAALYTPISLLPKIKGKRNESKIISKMKRRWKRNMTQDGEHTHEKKINRT